jgi:uncharacterized protein YacL (UPF0231 family)
LRIGQAARTTDGRTDTQPRRAETMKHDTIARTIAVTEAYRADAVMRRAEQVAVQEDNNWETETTVYYFADESRISVCGPTVAVMDSDVDVTASYFSGCQTMTFEPR